MGEIDTKPIESVQTVISFFGQSNDQKKNSPIKDGGEEQGVKKEREVEKLEKEVANLKVQLEAKDNAYKQALLMIDHHHKTANDLSILLNKSDLHKDFYINESREAKARIGKLEQTLSESEKVQESTLDQLMNVETQLTVLKEAKMEFEELQIQLETMHDLENQMIEKSGEIESLQMELNQANKAASDATLELNKLKKEKEEQEKTRLDQAEYTNLLEIELKQMRIELDKSKEQENESQVVIAVMKSELHKGRAKLAAAEAAETRAQAQKTALYTALQQMGIEAEEMNKEKKMLKEDERDEDEVGEIENVRRELETAKLKMGELRTRAEQATSRAEVAEREKAALEEKMRKRKEHKERRRAALAALREESISRFDDDNSTGIKRDTTSYAKNYQPLGKVLNMKY